MAWQNMLAQMPVIGGDLIQIDQLKRQNVQDERRNQLADIAMQRGEQQYQQGQQDRYTAEQRQQAEQGYKQAEWALGKPKAMVEQYIPELAQNYEKQNGPGSWAQLDDAGVQELAKGAMMRLGPVVGASPPQPEKPAQLPASVQEYEYGKKDPSFNDWRKQSRGRGITIGPDGTVQIGGEYNPTELGKPTRGNLEAAFISGQQNSVNLGAALAKWKPEFSTYKGMASAKVSEMKERLNLSDPADRQYLEGYTSWSSEVSNALSQYLNQLSGAAISPAEEQRLKAGFPNTDDSPSQYKAKTEATMRRFALIQARAGYMLSNPAIKLDSLSIDAMNNVIATEANKLQASYIKGGMNAEQARQKALADTRVRFGIGGQ